MRRKLVLNLTTNREGEREQGKKGREREREISNPLRINLKS